MSSATSSDPAAPSVTPPHRDVFVRDLADAGAGTAEVGGKGASLARLAAAGLPVPSGFHVTTAAYRRFVTAAGLATPVLDAVATADPERPETCERAAATIAALFAGHPLPDDVAAAVTAAYAGLQDGDAAAADAADVEVAVRSSATAEDLADLSFAGQQDSYLGVRGVAALHDAVRRCWASLWNGRAIAYRARNAVATDDVAIAVVVQTLVPADAAGVLFTADPVTGDRGRTVVDAAWGLGEAVVGGAVTPDTVVLDTSGGVVEDRVADKTVMTVRAGAGTAEVPVPEERRRARVLTTAEAGELAALGRRVERLYGTPMDVEWARAGGRFALVQARPITTLRTDAPAADQAVEPTELWNDSLATDDLWTATNLGEAVPDVVTPASWSFLQAFLSESMPVPAVAGHRAYGRIGGRLYLDVTTLLSLAAALGVRRRAESAVGETFGRFPAGVEVPVVKLARGRLLGLLGRMIEVRRGYAKARRGLPTYLAEVRGRCEAVRDRVAATDDPAALVRLWHEALDPLLHTASRMLGAAARGGGGALAYSARRLRRVSEEDRNLLMSGSGADGGTLASLGPVVGLARLARGELDRDAYTAAWGHRSPHEFEVSVPRPAEDPQWIDRQLAAGTGRGGDAVDLLARRDAARAALWDRIRAADPRRVAGMRRALDTWARVARAREETRSEVVRVFWPLRTWTVRAGELTGLGDDVFFLGLDEILAVLGGDRSPVAAVPERRRAYERYAALPPYPTWIRGPFDPFAWAADPDRRTDVHDATARPAPAAGAPGEPGASAATVTGRAGAGGVVEGVARVLAGTDEGDRLLPGEILVANSTNIGWTPLFPRAGAVVTDIGAPLSHAAIVARELGIPAVVGCGDATARIRTGDRLRVDGARGTVEILT